MTNKTEYNILGGLRSPFFMRTCNICGETKPLSEYYVNNFGNLHGKCKKCYIKKGQERYDPVKKRNENLRRNYGITLTEYDEMLESQSGKCKICGTTNPGGRKDTDVFVVDHCHDSDEVRGLLCHGCNTALGLVKDNPEVLHKMIAYLKKHQS